MGLSIEHLEVVLGDKHILRDVNLAVRSGEFFSLLGSSGCGKSTLLKTVAGLIEPKSGDIALDGVDLLCLAPQKRGTVIVFQDQRLFTNMTVGENVSFALRNQGVGKKERAAAADHYLDLVQMGGFASRRVHQLSGGQSQRVALARALAAKPKMLLLDEPFSALDENLRDDMRILVKSLQQEMQITTIMVTHDQQEALSMSDRVAIMSKGKILQTDTPENIYQHPDTFEIATFFSGADVLEGEVKDGAFLPKVLNVPVSLTDGSYHAIVRPGALTRQEEGVDFTVLAIQYLGETSVAVLETDGILLHLPIERKGGFRTGDHVSISIDPNAMLFFANEKCE